MCAALHAVSTSDGGDRQQRVVDLLPVGGPAPMGQQLLDGDPVVQDPAAALLHAPPVPQLQDGRGLLLAGGLLLSSLHPQKVEPALHHELPAAPLLAGLQQLLLALLFAPVAAHLHLTHGIVICGHASAPLLADPQGSLSQDSVASGPTSHIACAVSADFDLPLQARFSGAPAPLHLISTQTDQAELALGVIQGGVLLQQLHVTLQHNN